MSYDPSSVDGVLFGGYNSTTQTLPSIGTPSTSTNYQLNFDTAILNASVSSDCIIPKHQRSFVFCDVSTNATGTSSGNFNFWTWGFSENNQQNAWQGRNENGTADDIANGIIKDTARINVSKIFRMNGIANVNSLSQLGGFFI